MKKKSDSNITLSKKIFSFRGQSEFSSFSGDFNPIHIDPIAARRTLTGQCIVHGMHCLIWALESLFIREQLTVSGVKIRFLKPIFLNEEVTCIWNPHNNRISILTEDVTLSTIDVTLGTINPHHTKGAISESQCLYPDAPSFSDCLRFKDRPLNGGGNHHLGNKLFPNFCAAYGQAILCDLATASFLVGMKCPGLHSLFASFKATFDTHHTQASFTTLEGDERFRQIKLSFQGLSTNAEIEVFYRPVPRLSESITNIACQVRHEEFKDVRALIIGGSRGLGETVAKIIAAAGGHVVITYQVGESEAKAVRNEITSWGGRCEQIQLDVYQNNQTINYSQFNQIYYFATPKIAVKRNSQFDQSLDLAYKAIYLNGFNDICMNLIKMNSHTKVFYPSTVFIDHTPKGLEQYAQTKFEGEILCNQLNLLKKIKILVKRLPQLATDQNQTIIESQRTNAVECLLPIIREMSR